MDFEDMSIDDEYKRIFTEIPMYKCSQKDLDQFYPMSKEEQEIFDLENSRDDGGFYCVDFEKYDLVINNSGWSTVGTKCLYIALEPCEMEVNQDVWDDGFSEVNIFDTKDKRREDCITD